jgi:hypothetical protein
LKILKGIEMLRLSVSSIKSEKIWIVVLISLVFLETMLVLAALVPAQLWVRLFPLSPSAVLDGPFPPAIAPLITILLYVLPSLIGWLCRSWRLALLYATMPAWIGLGFFLVAATFKIGAFYLVASDHVTANVAILELFAVLGGMGWLARNLLKPN